MEVLGVIMAGGIIMAIIALVSDHFEKRSESRKLESRKKNSHRRG